jgi:nucleoside-diphosphate-sugar epimerase
MTTTLVTGGDRGIGREIVRWLVLAGHTVYLGAPCVEAGRETAWDLEARFVELDVESDESVAVAMHCIDDEQGGLDVLINADAEHDPAGAERMTRAALPALRRSSRAVIVTVGGGDPVDPDALVHLVAVDARGAVGAVAEDVAAVAW